MRLSPRRFAPACASLLAAILALTACTSSDAAVSNDPASIEPVADAPTTDSAPATDASTSDSTTSSNAAPDTAAPNATTPDASAWLSPTPTVFPLILDNCGFEVTFDQPPQRVLTIRSSTAEMMLALGLQDQLLAAAALDGPAPAWLEAEGTAVDQPLSGVPGTEATLALEPDLVFAGWESNLTAESAGERSLLASLGIATYVPLTACGFDSERTTAMTFDDVWALIAQVGAIFDVADAASALIAEQSAQLAQVSPDTRGLTALWWSSGRDTPFVGAGAGTPQMIMDAIGVTNVMADVSDTWTSVSWEHVLSVDPDVLILVDASWNSAEEKIEILRSNPATATLTAVREDRFIIVDFPATEAGVRSVSAVVSLAQQLAALNVDGN